MIKLTGNKIAVAPILDPDVSRGGIIIPDVAKERSDQGIVKYIGPDVKTLKPGDYILFSGYSGTVVNFGDSDGVLIIFREEFAVCQLGEVATEVPGLYFKEQVNPHAVRVLLKNLFNDHGYTWSESAYDSLMEIFYNNNPYFPATYETAVNLIAEAWRNTDFARSISLAKPGEPGRKKVAANPDYSHDEILRVQENEDG